MKTDDAIIIVRHNDGYDVIAKFVSDSVKSLKIKDPYYIHVSQDGAGISKYCVTSNERYFDIKKTKIEFVVTASDMIIDNYNNVVDEDQVRIKTRKEEAEMSADEFESTQEFFSTFSAKTAMEYQNDLESFINKLAEAKREFTLVLGNNTKH